MIYLEDCDRHVMCWPDNDGGLWYYHPITGQVVVID